MSDMHIDKETEVLHSEAIRGGQGNKIHTPRGLQIMSIDDYL